MEWAIISSIFATSVLSGVFGMAGGLILMGVLTLFLPVPEAMVVHGLAQAAANGFRFLMLARHADWKGVSLYAAGALLSAGVLGIVSFVPSRTAVFLLLGILPFAARIPGLPVLDFSRRPHALGCGIAVNSVQIAAGVAGPVLDLFFVRSLAMTRYSVIATKAATAVLSHVLKLAYFGGMAAAPSAQLVTWAVAAALAGTLAGSRILRSLSDASFRNYSRRIVLVIGAVYLVRAVALLIDQG